MKRLLILLLLFASALHAQQQNFPGGSGGGLTQVAVLPGTCAVGVTAPVQLTVAPYTIYVCTALNTWGPSSPPGGTTGQVQWNNGGILAGATGVTTSANTLTVGQSGAAQGFLYIVSAGGSPVLLTTVNTTTLQVGNAQMGTNGNIGPSYGTVANCSSGASPAVCAAAPAGSVAVPAGATPTLQINTTAVTANSQIFLTIDESLGTKLSVTCNTTLATLVQPVVTLRTPATSFTIQINATLATNPACVSYFIVN